MINHATLLGHVGKKDVKKTKTGADVTVLSLATSKKYKDAQGAQQEQTTWHNVSCFSKLAEVAAKYVNVGDLICVQGEIHNRKIESGEKAGQYVYSLQANDIKFIPRGSNSGNSASSKSNYAPKQQATQKPFNHFMDDELPDF